MNIALSPAEATLSDDDEAQLLDAIDKWVEGELKPVAMKYDHADEYPDGLGGLIAEGLDFRMTRFIEARRHQMQLSADILDCFDRCDVLVCPAAVGGAPDTSTTGDPSMNAPWSYTGLPTVSFPIGSTDDGMPLAVQLVGRPDGEARLFQVAAWCEDTLRAAHIS